ncbi:metal-dependent hydrolase [Sphingomicrobium aestuariivivum]|uniref:metal-dependent hydrolase n=1 Tax=Sphingomicrobium aestuariivivum TaxID=1582356 RepID=UPI001FD705D0|nr:metal-dependent hydrolase [Sphingomicrobium aestuariivivum]MCJ8191564.1 metal-dependent hydrolase [Sphingomicrobium aestuariivivum]
MATATVTPSDLTITPRDREFGRDGATPRWWHGGNPYATAMYNALSATFPDGEAFFVRSVRAFAKDCPEALKKDIKAFTTQEAIHSREHDAFNKRASESGYDMGPLYDRVRERIALLQDKPQVASLAATMVLEHYTAILAQEILANPKHFEGAEEATAMLWKWHAAEEIEHKGVAYDTWMHATRDWSRFKRWSVKAKVMLYVTSHFFPDRFKGALYLLEQDGITGWKAKWGLIKYGLVSPGMFRKILGAWLEFFLPKFHPWNEDDRELIAAYEDAEGHKYMRNGKKVRAAA